VERPWKKLFKPRARADKELFYASTVILDRQWQADPLLGGTLDQWGVS
jgi:hypothetical protein